MTPAASESAAGKWHQATRPPPSRRRRDSDGLRVTFSFAAPTPAALFRRADTVWLVFDHTKPIDIEPIRAKGGAIIGDVSRCRWKRARRSASASTARRCLRSKAKAAPAASSGR